jgi:pimeloyl-ACP methyl ester carboxylesterase
VRRLETQGADRVVVVGHSFGGGAAIAYGDMRGGVSGVVALAAGVDAGSPQQMRLRADSVARAEAMVASGRGDSLAAFDDFNGHERGVVRTTAARCLSYFSPEGNGVMHRHLGRWPDGLPLLWIDGSDENPARERMFLGRVPPGPLTRYVRIQAAHPDVAAAAADIVLAWIRCL